MATKKTLRAEVDELRAELAGLRKERADPVTPSSTGKPVDQSKAAKPSEPDEQDGETGNLEQMLKDMAEINTSFAAYCALREAARRLAAIDQSC